MEWDSSTMSMRLPMDKAREIQSKTLEMQSSRYTSRRMIESLDGSLNFVAQFSDEAMYRKKCFNPILSEWPKDLSRDAQNCLDSASKWLLRWWIQLDNLTKWNPVRKPEPTIAIWTDASEYGWGAHSEAGDWRAGVWCQKYKNTHINILEIKAVILAIRKNLVKGHFSVRVFTDNITTMFAINKNGSSRSR